jgi:hypothetical protein
MSGLETERRKVSSAWRSALAHDVLPPVDWAGDTDPQSSFASRSSRPHDITASRVPSVARVCRMVRSQEGVSADASYRWSGQTATSSFEPVRAGCWRFQSEIPTRDSADGNGIYSPSRVSESKATHIQHLRRDVLSQHDWPNCSGCVSRTQKAVEIEAFEMSKTRAARHVL